MKYWARTPVLLALDVATRSAATRVSRSAICVATRRCSPLSPRQLVVGFEDFAEQCFAPVRRRRDDLRAPLQEFHNVFGVGLRRRLLRFRGDAGAGLRRIHSYSLVQGLGVVGFISECAFRFRTESMSCALGLTPRPRAPDQRGA